MTNGVKNFGKREAASERGKQYEEAVKEYMDSIGMRLTSSARQGIMKDLVFHHIDSGYKHVVESKKNDNGLSRFDKQFVSELEDYYKNWKQERFKFWIFTTNLSNESEWNNLLKNPNEKAPEYLSKIIERGYTDWKDITEVDQNKFIDFICETDVCKGDSNDLAYEAKRNKNSKDYINDRYMKDYNAIKSQKSDEYITNLLRIKNDDLYKYDSSFNASEFVYSRYNNLPVEEYKGCIYSLIKLENCSKIKQDELNSMEFIENCDINNIPKRVMKSLYYNFIFNCSESFGRSERTSSNNLYYMIDENLDSDEKISLNRKWIVKKVDKCYIHRSLGVNVYYINNNYFYVLKPQKEFTNNGINTVNQEKRNDYLNDFNWSKFNNPSAKQRRVFDTWLNIFEDELSYNNQSIYLENINLNLTERPPEDGTERDNIVENNI